MSRIDSSFLVKHWVELGHLLGLKFSSATATQATCPLCRRGQIAFYSDPVTHGRRFVSSCCHRAGDQIQLIADVKAISRRDATLFMEVNLPGLFASYQLAGSIRKRYEEQLAKQQSVWDQAIPLADATGCQSFQNFIGRLGLEFTRQVTSHKRNLSVQYRWLTEARYRQAIGGTSGRSRSGSDWPVGIDGVLASWLYGIPGQATGLLLQFVNNHHQYRDTILRLDGENLDVGFSIHPEQALNSSELVVCNDPLHQLRGSFQQAHLGGELLNSYVTSHDTALHRTGSLHMLRRHPLIVWTESLTPAMLRIAIRLGAQVSCFGTGPGGLSHRSLAEIDPKSGFKSLSRRSTSWESSLGAMSRQRAPQELVELINASDLSAQELEAVQNSVEPHLKPFLQGGSDASCPQLAITGSYGSIEQSPKGWTLTSRGVAELICSRPWRVAELTPAVNDKDGPGYLLEFYDAGRWVGHPVGQAELHTKFATTMTSGCLAVGLPPISIAPKWVSSALHIALQLHPPRPAAERRSAGIDSAAGLLITNQLQISLLDGSVDHRTAARLPALLPLADGSPPIRRAIAALHENPLAQRVISSLLLQILYRTAGRKDVAVLIGTAISPLADQILTGCGFRDADQAFGIQIVRLNNPLAVRPAAKRLQDEAPLWSTASQTTACWLAGHRPTLFINRRQNPYGLEIEPVQLQRTVATLLIDSLKASYQGARLPDAILAAWRHLFRDLNQNSRGDDAVRLEVNQRPQPISRMRAMGYWIDRAMQGGDLECYRSRPRTLTDQTVWSSPASDTFWIARRAVNRVIEDHHYPAWLYSELFSALDGDQLTCDMKQQQHVVMLKLPVAILSPQSRDRLAARQRRARQPRRQTGTDS